MDDLLKELNEQSDELTKSLKETDVLAKLKEYLLKKIEKLQNNSMIDEEKFEKVKEINKELIEVEKNIQENERLKKNIAESKERNNLEVMKLKKEGKEQKKIIKKAIEIQELGLQVYFISFAYLLIGFFTFFQQSNFQYIQTAISNMDSSLKVYILWAAICIVEGNIIYKRSVNDAEKHLQKEGKLTLWQVIKFPNLLETGALSLITIYLYFPNFIGILINNEYGILLILLTNAFFLTSFLFQIKEVLYLLLVKFNKTFSDPKDRLSVLVAVMGTIISLIALFK